MKKFSILIILFGVITTISVNAQCFDRIITSSFHNLAIKSDHTFWAWGYNGYGQLGDGTTVNKLAPVQINLSPDWEIAAGENHSLAIKNGTLWAWGQNTYGQLGNGTTTSETTPVQIGTDTDWARVIAGNHSSYAIKNNGTLWAWGNNGAGRLGDGTIINRNTPVQITTATNWKKVVAGNGHVLAVKTDGTLWAWGSNNDGRLGVGLSIINLTVPTQVGTSTDWIDVSANGTHSLAIKSNHTLWAWGDNYYGQLGDGTSTDKSTPTQIGTDTNWENIMAGYYHSLAKKSDNTLWASGANLGGELGIGTTTNQSTFTQIGNDTNWTIFAAGNGYSAALKSDGSLWTWGSNSTGQLGNGTQSGSTATAIPTMINCPQILSVEDSKTIENLNIYPNPAKDVIRFSQKLKTIEIYSADGKKVLQSKNKENLNVLHILAGTYFIKAENANGKKLNSKFIKQ